MSNQLPPGRILRNNSYRIIEFIGQGGFGITYLAEEIGYYKTTGFGQQYVANKVPEKVVIKELYFDDFCQRNDTTGLVTITSGANKDQFDKLVNKQLEEGKILKSLNHDHIVKTRDIFKENDTAYMVMDFVDGVNLEDIIQKGGKLDRDKAITYIRQILSAVIYVHERKILHLDITPSNILIENQTDQAILIDFGASLTYNDDNRISATTSKLVTGRKRHYTPVEQTDLDNLKEFDATFDTYAIGASLYHMLTGTLPPIASLLVAGKQKLIPPSVMAQTAGITDYLDNIIVKALNSRYEDRYKSAAEMDNDLGNENKYRYQLNLVNKLLAESNFQEALKETEKGIELFGITVTFNKLAGIAKETLKQDSSEKRYELLWHQAMEELVDNNYEKALSLFEQAAKLFPDKKETSVKITFCRRKIEEAGQQQKIGLLLSEAKKNIRNGDNTKALALLNELLSIEPGNELAQVMQQELQRTQKQQQPGYTPPPPVVPPAEEFVPVSYEPDEDEPQDHPKTMALNDEANELISKGEFEKARQKLEESARLNPNNKATELLTKKLKDKIGEQQPPPNRGTNYGPGSGPVPVPPLKGINANNVNIFKQYKVVWIVGAAVIVVIFLIWIFTSNKTRPQPPFVPDMVKAGDSAKMADSIKARDSLLMLDSTKTDSSAVENTSGSVDLYETFVDNTNDWDVANDTAKIITIKNRRLTIEGLTDNYAAYTYPAKTVDINKDYTCSVSLKWIRGINNNGIGIAYSTNLEYGYRFVISADGHYCLFYYDGDGVKFKKDWATSDYINQGVATNILAVKKIGEHIYFYINGNRVTSVRATSEYGQYFGLVSEDKQTVEFRDFHLTGSPGK